MVITCPQCSMQVVALADGTCPSCGERIDLAPGARAPSFGVPHGSQAQAWERFLQSHNSPAPPAAVQRLAELEHSIQGLCDSDLRQLADDRPFHSKALAFVRNQILPQCQLAREALAPEQGRTTVPTHVYRLSEYVGLRQQSWEAFVLAVENHDREQCQRYRELVIQSELVLLGLKSAISRPAAVNQVAQFHASLRSLTPRAWVTATLVVANIVIFAVMGTTTRGRRVGSF